MENNNPRLQAFMKFAKKMRVVGIILAVLMMALGILALIAPLRTGLLFVWLFLGGTVLYGIYDIIMYIKMPAENRQTWTLVNGILCVILGVFALLITDKVDKILILSIALCFQLIMAGVGRLTLASQLKKEGNTSTGFITFSGVMSIICAAFFIFAPFTTTFIYDFIIGIHLIILGMTLLIELLSEPKPKKQEN